MANALGSQRVRLRASRVSSNGMRYGFVSGVGGSTRWSLIDEKQTENMACHKQQHSSHWHAWSVASPEDQHKTGVVVLMTQIRCEWERGRLLWNKVVSVTPTDGALLALQFTAFKPRVYQ